MEQLSAAAERGLALVQGSARDAERLREMHDLNRLAADQMPAFIAAFESSRRVQE